MLNSQSPHNPVNSTFLQGTIYLHKADFSREKNLTPHKIRQDDHKIRQDEMEEQPSPSADDLYYLLDFIMSTSSYIETLEESLGDTSEEFWESRDQAHRILTDLLIDEYDDDLQYFAE